jgi:hypothetical protein
MSELKRKQTEDYNLVKRRYEDILKSIDDTPARKPRPSIKNSLVKENPEERFKNFFSDSANRTPGLVIKSKKIKKNNKKQEESIEEEAREEENLGKIFSKFLKKQEPLVVFKYIEEEKEGNSGEEMEKQEEVGDLRETETKEEEICCTPMDKIIRIPESYKRVKISRHEKKTE